MVPVGFCHLDRNTPITRDVRRAAESDPDLSADSSSRLHTAAADRRRMKVLVIVPSLCVGGAETDLARNLPFVDRTRFEIVVCTFLERGGLAGQLTAAGIEVVGPFQNMSVWWLSLLRTAGRNIRRLMAEWTPRSAPGAWLKTLTRNLVISLEPVVACLFAYPATVRPIAHHIRAGEFDVVHAILPYSYLFGAWANRGHSSLIMSRVSQNWYHKSDRLLELLERYALHPGVNAAVCNSEVIAGELQSEGIPKSKIRVIYNGIDLPAYLNLLVDRDVARAKLGIDQDCLVFSSVGNLFAYKGHADLLQALHNINARLPRAWTLLAAGRDVDGNLGRLIELRNRLGLASHVRFLGERLDVPVILSASDIHVSASHTEGLPNNVLEAMSCGLPVVATAVGGVPEVVVDNETGLLVPARDVDALGTALLGLADDSEGRRRMGRAGHERIAACFTIQRSVAAFEQVYRDVLRAAA
jgi:glycosyltransferase involved in cell wall biosynthesis